MATWLVAFLKSKFDTGMVISSSEINEGISIAGGEAGGRNRDQLH